MRRPAQLALHTSVCFSVLYLHCCRAARCKDKCVCVCVCVSVCASRHTGSFILEAVITLDSSDKYHSLPEPALHKREASLTLGGKKHSFHGTVALHSLAYNIYVIHTLVCWEKRKKKTLSKLDQLKEYLCNAEVGMLGKVKVD